MMYTIYENIKLNNNDSLVYFAFFPPQNGLLLYTGNPAKVTGIKKIEGMSQEDFKLY